jgi:ribonuclease R
LELDRKIIEFLSGNGPSLYRLAELEKALGRGRAGRKKLKKTLSYLIRQGLVERKKGGLYRLAPQRARTTVRGVYRHNPAGYGFVDPVGGGDGVFVPPGLSGAAMDGDTVQVEITAPATALTADGSDGGRHKKSSRSSRSKGKRKERGARGGKAARAKSGAGGKTGRKRTAKGPAGWVEAVVQRNTTRLTGTALKLAGGDWILEPDDSRQGLSFDLQTPLAPCDELAVVAEVVEFPQGPDDTPVARVVEVLGRPGDVEVECKKILIMGGVNEAFDDAALAEAVAAAQAGIAEAGKNRRDLRDLPFLTIDPKDARDFDDAVCVELLAGDRHRLWVAIADVSHYVASGGPLDDEAQARGFSVYLPHRAVPMLPEVLSSNICSLEPEKDRSAMAVSMDLDASGQVRDFWLGRAVIRSRFRLDYETVAAVLSGDAQARRRLEGGPLDALLRLDKVSRLLWAKRRARGMLELELGEPKVVLAATEKSAVSSPQGAASAEATPAAAAVLDDVQVRDVVRQKPDKWVRQAYRLIEQCMLEANETVGRFFAQHGAPVVWRVHPPPDEEKLARFADLLVRVGLDEQARQVRESKGAVEVLAAVAKALAGRKDGDALGIVLLSSLMQATYSFENSGHYALAANRYLHFTSPIRRYADLMVHRALKGVLDGKGALAAMGLDTAQSAAKEDLRPDGETEDEAELIAAQISERERTLMEVEREMVDLFSALLMQDRIGETYSGTVMTATPFGVFVRLDHPYVEGLVRLEALGGGGWELDGSGHFLVQQGSGRRLGPGTTLSVEIKNVSVLKRQIELAPRGVG